MTQPGSAAALPLAALLSDEAAFEAWYHRVFPRVFAYLVSRTGRRPDLAEELTQQTFVEAVRHPASFATGQDGVPWLIGVARHRLVDHYRRLEREERRRIRLTVRETAVSGGPESSSRHRLGVQEALAALTPVYRAALLLRYMDRLDVRSIARELGRSEAATESLLTRARAAFAVAYGEPSDAD